MTRTLAVGLLGLSVSPVWAGTVPVPGSEVVEESAGIGASISVGYDSQYIFRGVSFADNSLWGQVDYAFDLTENLALDFGAWYETSGSDQYDELDLWVGLSTALGPVNMAAGFLWYYFPEVGSGETGDTQEVFYSLEAEVYGGVTLGFKHAYDFVPDGHYFALSAGKGFELTDSVSLDLSAGISYNVDYFVDGNGWNNVDLRAGLPIALTSAATLTPYIAYSQALEVLEDTGVDDYLYGGVSLSVSF